MIEIFCKSLHASVDPCLRRGSIATYISRNGIARFSFHCLPAASSRYKKDKEVDRSVRHVVGKQDKILPHSSLYKACITGSSSRSSLMNPMFPSRFKVFPSCLSAEPYIRGYASHAGGNQDGLDSSVSTIVSEEASSGKASDSVGNEWVDTLNNARKAAIDAVSSAGEKAKGISDEVVPYVQQLYDSQPYLQKVIVPVGATLSATALAWFVMPRILRKLHKYSMQSPVSLLSARSSDRTMPYEKSMWGALEDPARYLITFLAFSQLGVLIAPSTSLYISQAWRGATVLSFVWFLHRWKTNAFTSAMANQVTIGIDKDKLTTLDKISSVGLFTLGVMALAEACGVPVQSLLTIGGVGGVATAFASRDILGNLFSGLSLQFSQPFSIGDNIKAGSVEGQVVQMGLTTTSLLNAEKFPVIVPNSLFASQVIVNKSRAQFRAIVTKIPVRVDDIDKIPHVSEEIKSMLRSNPKVSLERDAPYCFLSAIDRSSAELTLGCNLVNMKKHELLATEQEILLQAARIIKQQGAELGSSQT